MQSTYIPAVAMAAESSPFGFDTSIEGMKSQEFSVAIFFFLIIAIIIFTTFVFMFMLKGRGKKSKEGGLKRGEKLLFAWILFGILVAIAFGAAQMLHGYLF